MQTRHAPGALGIIGGLGPLASAEFLKTIYEQSQVPHEQQMPTVIMYSDPSFPDRTEAWLNGSVEDIRVRLEKALDNLNRLEVSWVVICCITMHYIIPSLSHEHRQKILSLVDIILAHVTQSSDTHILICSTGTRRAQIFERHPCWPWLRQKMILPDEDDQRHVHELIHHIKRNGTLVSSRLLLDRFAEKYKSCHFICGCTEMHLLAKWYATAHCGQHSYSFLDPLMIVAQLLARDCVQ